MRIAIDVRALHSTSSGGVVQYMEGLCPALFRLDPTISFLVYESTAGFRLPDPLPGHVMRTVCPDDHDPTFLDARLADDRIDVLFLPFPTDEPLAFPSGRQLTLLPDLQHEDLPEFFSDEERARRRRAFGRAVTQGGGVGLLSEHAGTRLSAHFPDATVKTVLMPSGPPVLADALSDPLTPAEQAAIPHEPYFLYPANLWPHKNHPNVLGAFQRLLAGRAEPLTLVLTGHEAGREDLLATFADLPVRHLGFVRPRLLAELYRRSLALTYFSLYEGFGLPLLEAFQLGAPVLCSNTTSLTEVGGDAVLTCDPTDLDAMADLMGRVANSPGLCDHLRERGRARLAQFSWELPASNVIRALRELAQAPPRHEDVLEALRVSNGRLVQARAGLGEQAAELRERQSVIQGLRQAVDERTAWAESLSATAAERLDVIHAQEAAIEQLRQTVEALMTRGTSLAAEAEQLRAAADERLQLVCRQREAIRELRDGLEAWEVRGRAMAAEYAVVSAAAEERLRLIEAQDRAIQELRQAVSAWTDRILAQRSVSEAPSVCRSGGDGAGRRRCTCTRADAGRARPPERSTHDAGPASP